MSRSVCVITEINGSTRHEYTPIGVKFSAEGSKKPDRLIAHFTINNKVRENYSIAYIQDILNVDYLACIHNFQLSALDDRGYDLDGETVGSVIIPENRFVDVTTERFKGNYALDFNAVNQPIIIPNAKAISRIDLSGQFDIYVFFTPDQIDPSLSGNNPILWSFNDGSNGIEIGMTNSVPVGDTRGFVRVGNGTFDAITGTTEPIITGSPVLIRAFRGGDNIVHMEVNGIEDGTPLLKTGSIQPTGADLIFGNGRGNNDDYNGQIHQERTYVGLVLTQSQADTIRQSKPTPNTMKFGGIVWDMQDKESYKIAKCDSFSKVLVEAKFPLESVPVTFDLTSESFQSILQSITDDATTSNEFLVRAKDTFATTVTLFGNLIRVGSFLDIVDILFLYSETTFYITPRKLLIVETNAGHSTDHVFDQDSSIVPYDLTESEDNNTTLATSVILTSSTLLTEDSLSSPAGATSTFRKHISQIDSQIDLGNLAIRIRESRQTIKTKFVIKINTLINWVRFNQIVTINNTKKNITNDPFTVTQLGFEYPKSSTNITVNENDIDFFDMANSDSSIQQTLLDSTDT